jgi:GxxExxY protein
MNDRSSTMNELSGAIVDAAVEVHRTLGGPGLLESVYEEALARELALRGFEVQRQVPVPLTYKGARLATDLRLDMLVAGRVVVECKSTTQFLPVFEAQALTYLRLLDLRLALVINFGERLVKDGIHRVVNGL